jgi:DNA adenine methylase
MKIWSPLRIPGGKFYLQGMIQPLIADHDIWIDGMCAGCITSLRKPPAQQEIVNDINPYIVNFWMVLRDRYWHLWDRIKFIPYDQGIFEIYKDFEKIDNPLEQAIGLLVRNRMSRDGMMESFVDSTRQRRGMNEGHSSWETCKRNLKVISERIQNWKICNQNVIKELPDYLNNPKCTIFLDPPYLLDTRTSKELYKQYEVDLQFHVMLTNLIVDAKAQVILCGYDNILYNTNLTKWYKIVREVKVNMGNGSKTKKKNSRIEILWINRLP